MMIIEFIRAVKGQDLVKEFEKTYGSLTDLEKLYQQNMDNLKFYTDLEDWKHFLENPDEVIEDGKTMVSDKLVLDEVDIELMNVIKKEEPQSINDLAEMTQLTIKEIYSKIMRLEEQGLIGLVPGPKKTIVPVLKYDEWEIK